MICVYPADCTDFSANGLGVLSPQTATVTETLNGEYELQLVHPIDETGKWHRSAETRAGTLDLAYIAKDSCAEIEKQGASILRKLPAA